MFTFNPFRVGIPTRLNNIPWVLRTHGYSCLSLSGFAFDWEILHSDGEVR